MPVPVWGANGIIGYTKEEIYKSAQPLITCRGGCGLVQWTQDRVNVSNNAMAIILPEEDKDSSRYLYYTLLVSDFSDVITGSVQPQITMRDLNKKEIIWHRNKSERKSIAHILGTLDDKIELNRRMNETLEAMAQAIFKDWFVDFGPVRAKMEGRAPYLPKGIWDLFPDRLHDSEIGGVPMGWIVTKLSNLFEVNPRRSLKRGQTAPYVDMASMPVRGHMPHSVIDRPFGSGMRFTNGDTVIARITPCLENGKTAFIDFLPKGQIGWGSTEYIILKSIPPIPDQFAYCLARSTRFRDFAIRNMSGTSGRQRVSTQALFGFPVIEPPDHLALAFGQVSGSLLSRAGKATVESQFLAVLRDTLLPKLLSGEIRLGEAEKVVEVMT